MKLPRPAWPRLLPTRTVVGLATLGPLGRLPAPGSWGSLAGMFFFIVFILRAYPGGDAANLLISAVLGYAAVALCGEAEVRLGRTDPGQINLDEFVAVPLCFLGWTSLAQAAPAWAVLLVGFVLFRLYDVIKPFGIRRLQSLPGGWGVAIDDTAAALATCATAHVIFAIFRAWRSHH